MALTLFNLALSRHKIPSFLKRNLHAEQFGEISGHLTIPVSVGYQDETKGEELRVGIGALIEHI
jgi:hypothetical protein